MEFIRLRMKICEVEDAYGMMNPKYFNLLNIQSEIAYEFVGDDDDRFEKGESLLFFGEEIPSDRLEDIYQDIMAPWISQCPQYVIFEN